MTSLLWLAAAVMILGAIMLIAGVGAPALWIAVIAIGIAVVVITQIRSHHTMGS